MAKAKKECHTGFRNGDLFCFHCGASQKMPLPMDAGLAGKFMLLFDSHHKNCKKTWVEPFPLDCAKLNDELEQMKWWLKNGNQGVSSNTMFKVLNNYHMQPNGSTGCHPLDPSDFRRCYWLIKCIPQWESRLDKMRTQSKQWAAIVDNWTLLSKMLEQQMATGKPNGMY